MLIDHFILVTITFSHLSKGSVCCSSKQYTMQDNHYVCGLSLAKELHGCMFVLVNIFLCEKLWSICCYSWACHGRRQEALRSQKGTLIYSNGRRFTFLSISTASCHPSPMPKPKEVQKSPGRGCLGCLCSKCHRSRNVKIRTTQSCLKTKTKMEWQ